MNWLARIEQACFDKNMSGRATVVAIRTGQRLLCSDDEIDVPVLLEAARKNSRKSSLVDCTFDARCHYNALKPRKPLTTAEKAAKLSRFVGVRVRP